MFIFIVFLSVLSSYYTYPSSSLSIEELDFKLHPSHSKERPHFSPFIEFVPVGAFPPDTVFYVEKLRENGDLIETENITMYNPIIVLSSAINHGVNYSKKGYSPEYYKVSAYSPSRTLLAKAKENATTVYWDLRYPILRYKIEFKEDMEYPGGVSVFALPLRDIDRDLEKQTRVWIWRRIYFTDVASGTFSTRSFDYDWSQISTASNEFYYHFSEPGVYYMSVQGYQTGGNYGSLEGGLWTYLNQPRNDAGTFVGIAVVVCYENNTCPSIINGFQGYSFTLTQRIPNDMQLPIDRYFRDILVSNEVCLRLRRGYNMLTLKRPQKLFIQLPKEIVFERPEDYSVCDFTTAHTADNNVYEFDLSTCTYGPYRYMFNLWLNFTKDVEYGKKYEMKLRYDAEGAWQLVKVTPVYVSMPELLPSKLVVWFGASQLWWRNYPESYLKFGFNTIGLGGYLCGNDKDAYSNVMPAKRREIEQKYGFEKIYYGGHTSFFQCTNADNEIYDVIGALERTVIDESYFPSYLPESQRQIEIDKWQKGIQFFIDSGLRRNVNDIAYNGVLYKRHLEVWGEFLNLTQPDFMSFNIEKLCARSNFDVSKSQNAQDRRKLGESDENLHKRIVSEMFDDIYREIEKNTNGTTKTAWFGSKSIGNWGYPVAYSWDQFREHLKGSIPNPHLYTMGKDPYLVALSARGNRIGLIERKEEHLLPVPTISCYGSYDLELVFDWTFQLFLNGATGFRVYSDHLLNDVRFLTNLKEATRIITPVEKLIFEGKIAFHDFSEIENMVIGAKKTRTDSNKQIYVIAVTPDYHSPFHNYEEEKSGYFRLPFSTKWFELTDLRYSQEMFKWQYDNVAKEILVEFDSVVTTVLLLEETKDPTGEIVLAVVLSLFSVACVVALLFSSVIISVVSFLCVNTKKQKDDTSESVSNIPLK